MSDEVAEYHEIAGVSIGIKKAAEGEPSAEAPPADPPGEAGSSSPGDNSPPGDAPLAISEGQRRFALGRFLSSIAILPVVFLVVWFLEGFVTVRLMGIPYEDANAVRDGYDVGGYAGGL